MKVMIPMMLAADTSGLSMQSGFGHVESAILADVFVLGNQVR
jgi:hypothetical protein